ncbi:hypothetical protein [Halovivax gelatinilyticus]|uniref:hypothetical protein n=1 Tax=Halovivax gelatinilyticus TaxID=2961597 RepID=UPI0020CA2AD3|nr:hypothetical protein [Halovivax gelatinilyticus]
MGERTRNTSRRTLLKGIGATTAIPVGVAGVGSASRSDRYVGFRYDPKTFDIKREVVGRFDSATGTMVGDLDIGEYDLQIDSVSPKRVTTSGEYTMQTFRSTDDKRTELGETYPRLVELRDGGSGWVTGFVRTPTSLSRDGLVMVESGGRRRSEAERFLRELQGGR